MRVVLEEKCTNHAPRSRAWLRLGFPLTLILYNPNPNPNPHATLTLTHLARVRAAALEGAVTLGCDLLRLLRRRARRGKLKPISRRQSSEFIRARYEANRLG